MLVAALSGVSIGASTVARAAEGPPATPPLPAITAPRVAIPVNAAYPPGATGKAIVVLRVIVAIDGTVREATVLEGQEPFAAAALAALKGTHFEPATRGGQPVAAAIRFHVDFDPPTQEAQPIEPVAPRPPAPTAPLNEVNVRGYRTASAGSEPLTRDEIRQLPGAFGDPFRAIELLPGVTPIISGLPYYYVRGSPPSNVGYFIDGIRVPYLFHFGLGPAVIHPSLVEKLELYPGGYPAQFGRYAGAIVEADLRAPTGGLHGEANVRLIDSGAIAEAPFAGGRGSATVAGRFSYTAALISLLAENVSIAYRDYQAEVSYRLDQNSTLSLFTFGAFDLAGGVDDSGNKVTYFGSEFYRLDLRYDRALPDGGGARIATAFGLDRTRLSGTRFASDVLVQPRATLRMPLSGTVMLRAGLDATLDVIHGDPPAPYSEDDAQLATETALLQTRLDYALAAHADIVAKVTRAFEVTPGLRADVYDSGGDRAVAIEPRLASRLAVTDRLRLVQAYGLAHQPPAFPVPVPALTIGHLPGGLQSAVQTSGGVEADLPDKMTASAVLFHNAFFNMNDAFGAINSPQSQANAIFSRTRGSAYGVELSARRSLARRIGGFVSYTLSRSERSTDQIRPSAFDRTHVLNVALSADLGSGWRAGVRLLAYSGIPTRSASSVAAGASPLPDRTPAYYRVDLRIEKRWRVWRKGYLSFVAEMLNATVNKEVLNYTCSGTSCTANAVGPIAIPSLGIEGGF